MKHLHTLLLHTVTGASVRVDFTTHGDGKVLAKATVERGRETLTGSIERAYTIKAGERADYAHVVKLGATHTAAFDYNGLRLALDAAAAELLNDAHLRAERGAYKIEAAAAVTRAEYLRATRVVRRVLALLNPSGLMLMEAATDGHVPDRRIPVPGTDVTVDYRCPSLSAIKDRSPVWGWWGSDPLLAVTDPDWDLLAAETAALAEADAAADRAASEAVMARARELKTIVVPAEALAAYKRYRGDQDRAWEAEDEVAYMLIDTYGGAIEAQDLAHAPVPPLPGPIHPEGA